jgi:hypothetical protein
VDGVSSAAARFSKILCGGTTPLNCTNLRFDLEIANKKRGDEGGLAREKGQGQENTCGGDHLTAFVNAD